MSEEKLFLLMEHAEQLQETVMTQQKELSRLAAAVDAAVIRIKVSISGEVAASVSKAVAGEAKEQIQQLHAAVADARKGFKDTRLNGWLALIAGTVLALLIVTYGALQAYRMTEVEREELAGIRAEITAERETLAKLQDKTWGLALDENQNGVRWIALPRGWKFGQAAKVGNKDAMFIMKK